MASKTTALSESRWDWSKAVAARQVSLDHLPFLRPTPSSSRHINVGSDFQAELPELQTGPPSEDEEPATLVWKPLEEDDPDLEKPDRGSDRWTPEEKEAFQKAFHTYGKDFHLIQKQIPSKTVAQCVEYYYCWKKEQKLASSTLAHVSGKKIQTCQQGQETGRRGQTLLSSHTTCRFARFPWSHALGEAQQVLPRLLLCCCPEIRNCGAQL
ncbi:REST corepressor 2-like isoform X1 [Passer domesticus]|uniref:REST corepressor 2-like isoform X1 n=1 Tax=Passer domesticus TaxID=48849 RepID=UPI0030FEC0C3